MTRKIPGLLEDMASLLDGSDDSWARALRALAADYAGDERATVAQIRGMFGGMGSLNDLVISDAQGKVVRDKQLAFSSLRDQLFDAARQLGS